MRMTSTFAAVTVALGMSGAALAEGEKTTCMSPAKAVSADAIKADMDQLGYDVLSLKTDDGYLKARIVDRDSGGMVNATFDPVTGELLRAKPVY